MASKQQFNDGLQVAFGIAGGLLLVYAGMATIIGPIVLATSETYNVWSIWAAIPALWLGGLFVWIANKLDE